MSKTPPAGAAKPFLVAWLALRAAGIPEHAIAPVINGAVRNATGLSPVKARVWITGQLLEAEQADASYDVALSARPR